jgi:hypothetical protein
VNKEVNPLAVAAAIATWLGIALGLHAAAMSKLTEVEGEVRSSRIMVEHRLTRLEVKVDELAPRRPGKLVRSAVWGE